MGALPADVLLLQPTAGGYKKTNTTLIVKKSRPLLLASRDAARTEAHASSVLTLLCARAAAANGPAAGFSATMLDTQQNNAMDVQEKRRVTIWSVGTVPIAQDVPCLCCD